MKTFHSMPIDELIALKDCSIALSTRVMTICHNFGVKTVGDLLACSRKDLYGMKNCGRVVVWLLEARLTMLGLTLNNTDRLKRCSFCGYLQ